MPKILELFSGTKSVSSRFTGWDVLTVDNDASLHPDICGDVLTLTADDIERFFGAPDVIWASPPCQSFSVAAIGKNWTVRKSTGVIFPKTERAQRSIELVEWTLKLIRELDPKYYFIENPRGMLRTFHFMKVMDRYTVTYCQYGDSRQKPTDIWTNHPAPQFKPMCKPRASCHQSAPRGARTGTQGLKNAKERGRLPVEFCDHIFQLCGGENAGS
jgi:hypothetical protein